MTACVIVKILALGEKNPGESPIIVCLGDSPGFFQVPLNIRRAGCKPAAIFSSFLHLMHAISMETADSALLSRRSVFAGVVGGTAGTFSKITGALGKGLASLTFDDKFQQKRREQIKKRGRQTFGESFARSGKGLVMGFVDGATGVVTKAGPIGRLLLY